MTAPLHIRGETFHGRRGAIENAFRYSVDYVLLDMETQAPTPWLFSRNRRNIMAIWDRDHGGETGKGQGTNWVRSVLVKQGLKELAGGRIRLLTQPRVFGYLFNPVSFWLIHDDADILRAVIAEVNNTYHDRHSYLCYHPDLAPIEASDRLTSDKIFHVSPFQEVGGSYTFRFDFEDEKIGVWIDYRDGENGVFATLTGAKAPMTGLGLAASLIRRPFGSLRVMTLIHWQALKLKLKGAVFRSRATPPTSEVS